MTNLNMRSYNEKRDFIRMKVETSVVLTLEGSNQQVEGLCKDLSGTGMLIEVSDEIKEGTVCDTRLPSNNEAFPSLDAKIKILRCSPLAENGYLLGVEIVEISSL